MSRGSVHVIPNSSKREWSVKRSGTQRASVRTTTKAEAVKIGRVISERSRSELIIHKENDIV